MATELEKFHAYLEKVACDPEVRAQLKKVSEDTVRLEAAEKRSFYYGTAIFLLAAAVGVREAWNYMTDNMPKTPEANIAARMYENDVTAAITLAKEMGMDRIDTAAELQKLQNDPRVENLVEELARFDAWLQARKQPITPLEMWEAGLRELALLNAYRGMEK